MDYVLRMEGVSKIFPGVKALDNVTFRVKKGHIHALVGENGAGKSTLMKVLNGVLKPDEGKIFIGEETSAFESTLDAQRVGLSIIFQEFNLVDTLTVAENIFVGRLDSKNPFAIDWKRVYDETEKILCRIGYKINPKKRISDLSIAEKQMVEIAKALSYNSKIIVMDEPSATLTQNELKNLFKIINELKQAGMTVIYISHRLEEVFLLSDMITVLRDGKIIDTLETCKTNKNQIIEKMVGRSITDEFPVRAPCIGEIVLEIKNFIKKGIINDISFNLRRGEILGIAGLVGSGRTELVRAIFGADKIDSGEIVLYGKKTTIKSVKAAIKNRLALATEDRKSQGLILKFSISKNISITNLKKVCRLSLLSKKMEVEESKNNIDILKIKTPTPAQKVMNLSGGNQQKVVLGKWLHSDGEIIILDEPTRGVDVGAKFEIYELMNRLVAQGKSIIMISSELPEVLGMSDRILVMYGGKVKGEFKKGEITAEKVIEYSVC